MQGVPYHLNRQISSIVKLIYIDKFKGNKVWLWNINVLDNGKFQRWHRSILNSVKRSCYNLISWSDVSKTAKGWGVSCLLKISPSKRFEWLHTVTDFRSHESLRWHVAMGLRPSSCLNIFFSRHTGPILTIFCM